jgi:hypothetical protein
MPSLTGPLTPYDHLAVVNVTVTIPHALAQAARRAGGAVLRPYSGRGLLDTGASLTGIDTQVVQALGLRPFSQWQILTPSSGPTPPARPVYKVDLTIPHPGNPRNNLERTRITAVEATVSPLGLDVLVGTDVLSTLRFVYEGRHSPPGFGLFY